MSRLRVRRAGVLASTVLLLAGSASYAEAGPLPPATTQATIEGLPRDSAPFAVTTGTLMHPDAPVRVHTGPDGPAVAVLPDTQLGNPTWVPVVAESPGWIRVLLPSRPNRSTGWVRRSETGLRFSRTTHLITVDRSERRLTLHRDGRVVRRWRVAVGAPGTRTPVGRTFVLASLDARGRLVLPTGTHSESLDTYGGGPGTVALHGWPRRSAFGRAVSHGCVRVPSSALRALAKVPLGTLVLITY
ncbi:L,D-transpeptidase [Nonomuraea sp. NPDC050556]|uniref:L,D-transpeptidase n=1 Tax=Nonomuraea sp. NPDC050556 TaxID=3364369 RepID=UPI0037AD2596